MPAVDRTQATPLYHQIFLQLKGEIISGERLLGERMPTEQELTEQFGVSRITARRALDALAETGLVSRKRRVGTRVIYRPPAAPLHGNIDQAIDSLVSFGQSTQVRLLSMKHVEAHPPLDKIFQISRRDKLTCIARVREMDGEPIGHSLTYIPERIGKMISRKDLLSEPILSLIRKNGHEIGSAQQTITAIVANAVMSPILKVEIGAPLLHIGRTVFDTDGKVLQHILVDYRSDRYQIRFNLDSDHAG